MTSVRTCYCKHEGNVARKKDNDIGIHNGNRHLATKKSIVTNATRRGGREFCKRARRVVNERTPNTDRSVAAQPSNPVLSPETSIALENAEKIINNAKIQLEDVCATSGFDSARRNRNTYLDEPPLDDEVEERLYVRELVACKFNDACSSRLSGATGKASARSEKRDFPRVAVRRVDLSAPKFRVSRRRRRADWSSLGYGSDGRSHERVSSARVSSENSAGTVNETTARDDCARDRRRMLSARGNVCEIQVGPSVHIVDRELIRQDLEDVHISPEASQVQSRANTATYTMSYDVIQNADNGANDPEVSGTPKTRRVRLDALQRGKPIERPFAVATIEVVPMTPAGKLEEDLEDVKNSGRDDGRIEAARVRNYRQERKDRESDPQDAERISERLKSTTSRGAAKFAVIETPGADRSERLKNNERNESHEGITASGSDTGIRYAEDSEIFYRKSGADCRRNDEKFIDKIQAEENQGDRSKPSPGGDTSRKAGFPRRENIAPCCREAESPGPYRTIDRHFLHAFNSHNGQDGPHDDVAGEDVHRRSLAPGRTDVFRETNFAEDDLDGIDLYRPHLDDLDSILYSNDRKIERVARATRNLSELLSGSAFAMYKLDEDERAPQGAEHEKLCRNSSADKDGEYSFAFNEPARSSILETELRNVDLTVSEVRRTGENSRGTNAAETKSSAFTGENGSRGNCTKSSVESSVFPASDASDGPRTFRDSDKTQRSAAKAPFSESSMNRSDATTFSNLVPALSSTHTETQACRHPEEEIARGDRHADAESRIASAPDRFSEREIRRSGKGYADDGIFARFFRKGTASQDAADRFVAYILQDEKRSIEGKIAGALKNSAVTPAAVQKLLDHLREVELSRDARQTQETLDILRNILINIKSQAAQGNDEETSSRNVPESTARTNAPPNAIGITGSREEDARQTRAKIDANEIERVAKNSYELKPRAKSLDERSDFSGRRKTGESARSTTRCESTQYENNSKRDEGSQTKSVDVSRTVLIDAKNQTDKDVNENDPRKEETLPRNGTGSLIRMNATPNATEGTILRTRAKNHTSDTGQIAGEFNDSRNPDNRSSVAPAVPEMGESVRSATHSEAARGSENNSKNNSKGNSCSEAESLKQISDIRNDDDDDENPGENSVQLSTKIASARPREGREVKAADLVAAIAVSEYKEGTANTERLGEDKSNDVQGSNDHRANELITQADQLIDARSDIPEGNAKEITSEKTRDRITSADKRALLAFSDVPEIKSERVRSDASPAGPMFIDEDPTRGDVGSVRSSAKEDTGALRETKIDPQHAVIKEKISPTDNNCSADPPRDCTLPRAKSSGSSSRKAASRNKQISFDIPGKDNSMWNTRNEEIRGSMTLAAIENRRDGNVMSEKPRKTARGDNERGPIDLTDTRECKIDVLSGSNSSVSSTLLDDRSSNGRSSADARRVGTTSETSHSEGELYMPSSCSYSLGEVRVLRRKRDFVEDNPMDRDSSVTVLVTRSMLTSLNDSTVSLLESSGCI